MTFAQTELPTRATSGLRLAQILIALLYLRWAAGIGENLLSQGMLSEAAALILLLALVLFTAARPCFAHATALLVTGLLAWAAIAVLSFAANNLSAYMPATELVLLLCLYALFANALFQWLGDADSLTHLPNFARCFLAVGVALALYQYLSGNGFTRPGAFQVPRAYGSDVHPVSFGIQIVAAMTILFVAGPQRTKLALWRDRVLLIAGFGALYLTLARTAWMMAAVVILCVIAAQRGAIRKLAAFLAALGAALWMAYSGRFADLQSVPQFLAQLDWSNIVFDYRYIDNSISWRIVNWGYGIRQALELPLLGHGPGQSVTASAFQLEMHSIFLEVFFEFGLTGLLALCLVMAGIWRLHARVVGTRQFRWAVHGFGLSMLAAVAVSTGMIDQLMTILLYLCLLRLGAARPRRT